MLRSSVAKAETEVQTRVREALTAENELLQSRVNRLEKENRQLSKLLDLIVLTLKKTHGIELDIDDEIVTIRTQNGTHTARVI